MELNWDNLHQAIASCRGCVLCQQRRCAVPGEGNSNADVMFIGEGPGQVEDETGRPFVGPAGQLLDRMLAAISLDRSMVYIANVVKCRPPRNRVPLPEEQRACLNFLRAQFLLVRPKILVCLGSTAARAVIDPEMRITRSRGQWVQRKGVWMMATYHPSALLRDETGVKKREAWQDMKALRSRMKELGIAPYDGEKQ